MRVKWQGHMPRSRLAMSQLPLSSASVRLPSLSPALSPLSPLPSPLPSTLYLLPSTLPSTLPLCNILCPGARLWYYCLRCLGVLPVPLPLIHSLAKAEKLRNQCQEADREARALRKPLPSVALDTLYPITRACMAHPLCPIDSPILYTLCPMPFALYRYPIPEQAEKLGQGVALDALATLASPPESSLNDSPSSISHSNSNLPGSLDHHTLLAARHVSTASVDP